MTSYPEYKATNLPWLPQIPTHWNTLKVKYAFSERSEKGFPNEPLLAATQTHGVIPKSLYETRTVEAQKDLHLLKLVKVGDFVISLRSFQGGIEYAYYQGIISPAYTIMIPNNAHIESAYFKYLAKSKPFVKLLQTCVTGIREGQNIDYNTLKRNSIPIPSATEQKQIVRYLDSMTAKINKLIRAKKKQIALLQEQKQAIINQAVTKGLNPNAEMKDSGIDWLGQIPAHWAIKKFSKVASIKSNLVKPENYYDYPQVSPDKIEKHTGKLLPVISVKDAGIISNNHLFFKGQILYSKIRPLLNKVAIAPFDGLCSADMYPIETILETEYLKFFMLSTWFLYQIKQSGDRVKMPKINQEEMAKLEIVIPSKHEQKDIVRSIYECWNQIDMVLKSLEKSIQTLSEYKNSLIASVVTGQVDIRNIQVENFDPADLISDTDDDPVEDDDQPQEESEE